MVVSPPPSSHSAMRWLPSSRTSTTSSSASWIWAVTTSGLISGSFVTACRTHSVWVPVSFDQLAFSSPFISRSSDRGKVLPFVVAPPASVKTTPLPPSSRRKCAPV